MRRIATMLLSLAMVAGALAALPTVASADSGVTVNIRTLGADSGAKLTGACYQIVDASNVGCDENGDGDVWFKDMAPGTYTVTQTQAPDGYQAAADFRITVVAGIADQVFPNYLDPVYGTGSVDVAIVSRDEATGQRLTGACYQIVGWSNVGCDVNGDGQVDFADIPVGKYPLKFVTAPAGYHGVAQSTEIYVTANDGNPFVRYVSYKADAGTATDLVDVSIVSAQEFTNTRLNGACYRIVDWSNVGCDVNNDGQVDFSGIPVGTYQIEIVQKPDGYTPEAQPMELEVTDQGGARLFHTVYYLSAAQICPEC